MVFGRMSDEHRLADAWWSPHMADLTGRLPGACGDCIDRSANVMLNGIHDVLRAEPDAAFFRFAGLPGAA
jgi:hypothetical protein